MVSHGCNNKTGESVYFSGRQPKTFFVQGTAKVKRRHHGLKRFERTQNNGSLPRQIFFGAQRLSKHAPDATNEFSLRGAKHWRISQHNHGRGKRGVFSPRSLPDWRIPQPSIVARFGMQGIRVRGFEEHTYQEQDAQLLSSHRGPASIPRTQVCIDFWRATLQRRSHRARRLRAASKGEKRQDERLACSMKMSSKQKER